MRGRINAAAKVDVEWNIEAVGECLSSRYNHIPGGSLSQSLAVFFLGVPKLPGRQFALVWRRRHRRRIPASQEVEDRFVDSEGYALQRLNSVKYRLHLAGADSLSNRILNRWVVVADKRRLCPMPRRQTAGPHLRPGFWQRSLRRQMRIGLDLTDQHVVQKGIKRFAQNQFENICIAKLEDRQFA